MDPPKPPPSCYMKKDGIREARYQSFREYAAIKLCVPDSGTDWLDDMIRTALRDRFAGMAMQGILACPQGIEQGGRDLDMTFPVVAETAYEQSDAMLKEKANGRLVEQAKNG